MNPQEDLYTEEYVHWLDEQALPELPEDFLAGGPQ